MPMCHNIVEGMAAGCIPITNYAGWFWPPLTDGENCLTFTDPPSLLAAVRRALSLPAGEIARLRAGVLEYYDTHLSPTVVPAHIDALPDGATVYLQTELAGPLSRVQLGSVAFPGTPQEMGV